MKKEENKCAARILFQNFLKTENQELAASDVMNKTIDEKEKQKVMIENFWNIISILSDGVQFPNTSINNLMVSFSEYAEKGKIRVVGYQPEGGIIQHILEEEDDSILYIPKELDRLPTINSTYRLSQIIYAASELVIFEQNKEKSKYISFWQIRDYATAYEAEFLLTLRTLSHKNKYPLILTELQQQVLKWYPRGLKSYQEGTGY